MHLQRRPVFLLDNNRRACPSIRLPPGMIRWFLRGKSTGLIFSYIGLKFVSLVLDPDQRRCILSLIKGLRNNQRYGLTVKVDLVVKKGFELLTRKYGYRRHGVMHITGYLRCIEMT